MLICCNCDKSVLGLPGTRKKSGTVTLTMRDEGDWSVCFVQANVTCSNGSNAPARKVR